MSAISKGAIFASLAWSGVSRGALAVAEFRSSARLLLDFLSGTLDPRITFSRGTGATRVNQSGFIETVGNTTPRFDYDPVTLAPRGLLIEEARTNLLLRSEEFDNASWSKVQLNTTGTPAWVNQTASPDGLTTADKLIPTAVSAQHYVAQAATVTAAAHTFTAYAKAAEYGFCVLSFYGATTTVTDKYAVFNLATGAATDVAAGVTASAVNAGNGWYRLSITFTMLAAASVTQYIFASNASTYAGATFTGNGTSGIYVWGADLELGAFATSYIPTVASTVTRNADVATMTGTNFSSWYNQSEGTFVAAGDSLTAVNASISSFAIVSDGTNLEYQGIFADNSAGRPQGTTFDGGAVQCDLSNAPFAISPNVPYAASFAYKLNDFGMSTNGSTVATDALGTLPTVNLMGIGNRHGNSRFLSGHIRTIAYFNTRLPNAQLQTLTAPSLATTLHVDFTSGSYLVGF